MSYEYNTRLFSDGSNGAPNDQDDWAAMRVDDFLYYQLSEPQHMTHGHFNGEDHSTPDLLPRDIFSDPTAMLNGNFPGHGHTTVGKVGTELLD